MKRFRLLNFFIFLMSLMFLVALVSIGGIWSTVSGQTVPMPNATPAALPRLGSFSVVKQVEPILEPGQKVRFTLFISNPTQESITSLTLTDSIPDTFNILSVSSQKGKATTSSNLITLLVPIIEAGERVTVVTDATLKGSLKSISITSTATFTYSKSGKSFSGESSPGNFIINFTDISSTEEFSFTGLLTTSLFILGGTVLIMAIILGIRRKLSGVNGS